MLLPKKLRGVELSEPVNDHTEVAEPEQEAHENNLPSSASSERSLTRDEVAVLRRLLANPEERALFRLMTEEERLSYIRRHAPLHRQR